MASRNFNRKQALEKQCKELYAKLTFGSSGAVTLTTGYGIASVTKSATGDYKITLSDKYVSLKYFDAVLLKSSGEDIRVQLKAESVNSAKTIDFYTLTGSSATNPSSGSALLIKLELKNTSAV